MGTFRIESLIVEARRGQVYHAVDEKTEGPVCLRVFKEGRFEPKGPWTRIPRHPGIAAILETGVLRGRPYAVMEWLGGKTLAVSGGKLEQVLPPLLDAVAAAHDQGVVHGHLRAHNIHLESRRPVIADYGLHHLDGDRESARSFVSALAPEQIRSLRGTVLGSDVYGLGVIGYTLLAGRMPFEPKESLPELVRAIEGNAPPLPHGPAPLVQLVMRMLEKEARDRPTCREALRRIREIVGT